MEELRYKGSYVNDIIIFHKFFESKLILLAWESFGSHLKNIISNILKIKTEKQQV